jgi:lipopolysaccharide/colanic/teichoic acid biosynthesis glycosyltransferase
VTNPQRRVKRTIDLIGAVVFGVLALPVAAVVASAIFLSMGRPVFFRQDRPGLNQQIFTMYKFRTMRNPLPGINESDSERLTPFGRVLRSASFDELPQLINIVKGQMSFIGPRPLLVAYLPYFSERERLRFAMRPGLTGLAQITGRNHLDWDPRLALDIDYIENWSLTLDLRITLLTVKTIAMREGYAADQESLIPRLDDERG